MIAYCVSCTIDRSIASDWEKFFLEEHLDDVLHTGCFTDYSFRKELSESEEDKVTYIAEYYAANMENYQAYLEQFAPKLKKDVLDRFSGKFTASRQLLEILSPSRKSKH